MPTIQQLVRKEERFWLRKVSLRHWIHVLKDVVFVFVCILLLRKNRIQQCVRLLVYV